MLAFWIRYTNTLRTKTTGLGSPSIVYVSSLFVHASEPRIVYSSLIYSGRHTYDILAPNWLAHHGLVRARTRPLDWYRYRKHGELLTLSNISSTWSFRHLGIRPRRRGHSSGVPRSPGICNRLFPSICRFGYAYCSLT